MEIKIDDFLYQDIIALITKVQRDTGRDFILNIVDQTVSKASSVKVTGLLVSDLLDRSDTADL